MIGEFTAGSLLSRLEQEVGRLGRAGVAVAMATERFALGPVGTELLNCELPGHEDVALAAETSSSDLAVAVMPNSILNDLLNYYFHD